MAPPLSRGLVALFACASGLSVANVYYAQPLLDALAHDFLIPRAAIGGVVLATQIGSALALVLLVPLGDLLNRRRLMLVQSLCWRLFWSRSASPRPLRRFSRACLVPACSARP